ncbi:MAG: hypothetical protein JO267_11125 [Alphaproteobacteria bacterium]|nr:hypothetical protein [Alphaproteobacteria bacterium]
MVNSTVTGGPTGRSAAARATPQDPAGIGLLLTVIFIGPTAWFVQFCTNYGLDSHPCYPNTIPMAHLQPGWSWVVPTFYALNFAAMAIALAAGFVSLRFWRKTREGFPPISNALLPPSVGRIRFLAIAGMLSGFGAFGELIGDLIPIIAVPPCFG